jgi:prepilin-type processing-associated H-X9-DG protein
VSDVTDSTSQTLMVVEVAAPDVHWMQPVDLDVNDLALGIQSPRSAGPGPVRGILSYHPGGVHVSLADGSVRFVSTTLDAATLRAMFTRAGGESVTLP